MGAASWLAYVVLVAAMVSVVVGVGLLRDPGFDATWKAKNYSEAQRGWHPFVNGFHPSTNPKLSGTASLGISSTWPAGAFQYVPGANLPSVKQYTFAAWTLVDSARVRVPSGGLANVTVDVAYVGGGADSFTVAISSKTNRSTYHHSLADEESEQDWAAQRHTVWKEEWQRHCFTFAVDDADQVKSITVFLVSSRQHRSSDTVQLWVDQADLFPADDPAIVHANCTQLPAVARARDSMNDRYQLHVATCASDYAASSSDVTLVTHLSISQLPLLNDLASNWKGPISAAVLIPNRSSLADLISAHKFDPALREWTTLHAVYPNSGKERWLQTYPGGFLRSVASNAAVTTHVLHVGVNYLPAARLRSDLEELMPRTTEDGTVYVVPSFAPHWDVNAATIPISKRALAEHLRHGRVSQVRGSGYRGFNDKDESDERIETPISGSDLHSPFVVLPKALSRFDERLEGKCEMELDALKVLLDMGGHSFVYVPRGYVLRTSLEPSPQSCWSSDLGDWRAWYAWLVSNAIEHGVSPVGYRYRPVGEPYARGRGITGVVSLMLEREPLFALFFLVSCVLTLAVVVGRNLRERQRDIAWGLPTHKGE